MKIEHVVILAAVLSIVFAQNTTTISPTVSPTTAKPEQNITDPRNDQNNPANIVPTWALVLIAVESALVVVICCCACAVMCTIGLCLYVRRQNNTSNQRYVGSPNNPIPIKEMTPMNLHPPAQTNTTLKPSSQSDHTSHSRMTEDNTSYEEIRNSTLKKLLPRQKRASMKEGIEWRKGEILGVGAYGKVYAGLNLVDGCIMAVKKMRLPPINDPTEAATIRRIETELELMQQLSHPNVVQYLGMQEQENHLYVFLEYMAGGSLISVIKKFGTLTEPIIQNYLIQILTGLEYLHENNVIHRDIKGANILMDRGEVKLADFGLSKLAEMSNQSASYAARGTPGWMAWEIIRNGKYSFASDIWAVGCVIIEMVTGKMPWEELGIREPMALMMHIATSETIPKIPIECMSKDLIDLTRKCLSFKPEDRPSASELLKHPFLTKNLENKHTQNAPTESIQEFSEYEGTLTEEIPLHQVNINVS